jgi:hypothetical protein
LTNKTTLIDRDRIVNADRTTVARLCVLLFDRIQTHSNYEEQILALAAAFLLMCEACGIAAQDAFTAVKNLMADPLHADRIEHRFAAMKYHLETELLA